MITSAVPYRPSDHLRAATGLPARLVHYVMLPQLPRCQERAHQR